MIVVVVVLVTMMVVVIVVVVVVIMEKRMVVVVLMVVVVVMRVVIMMVRMAVVVMMMVVTKNIQCNIYPQQISESPAKQQCWLWAPCCASLEFIHLAELKLTFDSHLSHHCDKIPDGSSMKEEGFILVMILDVESIIARKA